MPKSNEKLKISNAGELGDDTKEFLESFAKEKNFQGVALISDAHGKRFVNSQYDETQSTEPLLDRPFATHSVSKVFAGTLVAEMIANGTISEDELKNPPVKLNPDILRALPAAVQERLQKVSLLQLMRHESGLGGYLDYNGYGVSGYSKKVVEQLQAGEKVEPLTKPEDYLPFAEEEMEALGEQRYSDLGILLMGLSAQEHYNKNKSEGEKKTLDEIMRELVLEPAGITNFSAAKPENAVYNEKDPIAPHIYGSPACGYFTTVVEMEKFGHHLYNRWQDAKFKSVIEECNPEFYDKKRKQFRHAGGIDSSKTWLSVDLNSGVVVFTEDHSESNQHNVYFAEDGTVIVKPQDHLDMENNPNGLIGSKITSAAKKAFVTKEELDTFFSLSAGGINTVGLIEYQRKENEEVQIKTSGSRNFYDPSQPMTAQTIVGIGSISKQFTAATLIKLWDDELTEQKLVNRVSSDVELEKTKTFFLNGLDTKLEIFLPSLRKQYAQCSALFDKIEQDENYHEITLRDLLNHTHGLGARNSQKAEELVRQANGAPLDLSSIANITEKREGEKYGKHFYGNFGYDLAAMIIETVAIEKGIAGSFDDVVTKLVLQPNQLSATHTQRDHADLYASEDSNIATGFAVDSKDSAQEFKMNSTSNTRAAGGFKSSVEDLARFALLFMNAEMFANEEVKQAVLDRKLGVPLHSATELNYHVAIQENPDGTIGHNGNDIIFSSKLSYNPQTKPT